METDGTLISTQEVNPFFAKICTTYPSLSEVELNTLIEDCECDEIKQVSEYEVYREIRKLRNKYASYPGELPLKLLREYATFLAKPLTSVINQCFNDQSFLQP